MSGFAEGPNLAETRPLVFESLWFVCGIWIWKSGNVKIKEI